MRVLFVAAVLLCVPSVASAQETLTLTYSTTTVGGNYADDGHVTVAWVETAAGAFVKTLVRYSDTRTSSLINWIASAGAGDTDAVSGATLVTHDAPVLAMSWDFTDRAGNPVGDGSYLIKLEMSEDNPGAAVNTNATASVAFAKDGVIGTRTPPDTGGFTGISIVYDGPERTVDAGPIEGPDAGVDTPDGGATNPAVEGGEDPFVRGGCSVPGGGDSGMLPALAMLGLMLVRRRRA